METTIIVYIYRLYKDNGKENGNYYNRVNIISGLRSCDSAGEGGVASDSSAASGGALAEGASLSANGARQDNPDII